MRGSHSGCTAGGKSIQAALADPDVTGVMDGGGLAAAKTCLFQSPIVWYSVIIVYTASQQPVSCVYYPFAKKKKKKGACVSSHSAHVFPLSKMPFSHFHLSHFL